MSTILSCQDKGEKETLPSPCLRSGFSYLYQQSLVAPESAASLEFHNSCSPKLCGKNVMLLVDTEDADEVKVLVGKVKADLAGDNSYIVLHSPSPPIEQAYNELGIRMLADRIEAMADFVGRNRALIQTRDIGTIVVGAIQSYVRTSKRDGSGAAFEMVLLYNATTGRVMKGESKGVPLQAEYLREARGGKTTYGEALNPVFCEAARKRFGCNFNIAKDWCWAVSGQSRLDRMQAVAQAFGSIFAICPDEITFRCVYE